MVPVFQDAISFPIKHFSLVSTFPPLLLNASHYLLQLPVRTILCALPTMKHCVAGGWVTMWRWTLALKGETSKLVFLFNASESSDRFCNGSTAHGSTCVTLIISVEIGQGNFVYACVRRSVLPHIFLYDNRMRPFCSSHLCQLRKQSRSPLNYFVTFSPHIPINSPLVETDKVTGKLHTDSSRGPDYTRVTGAVRQHLCCFAGCE